MEFPIDRLQILDMSVLNEDKIIQPVYDVILSFTNKSEAETVKNQILQYRTTVQRLKEKISMYESFLHECTDVCGCHLTQRGESELKLLKSILNEDKN